MERIYDVHEMLESRVEILCKFSVLVSDFINEHMKPSDVDMVNAFIQVQREGLTHGQALLFCFSLMNRLVRVSPLMKKEEEEVN